MSLLGLLLSFWPALLSHARLSFAPPRGDVNRCSLGARGGPSLIGGRGTRSGRSVRDVARISDEQAVMLEPPQAGTC